MSERIIIVGGPKTGKTTLSSALLPAVPVQHTDDLIHLPWSEVPDAVIDWMLQDGPWIIEGVQTARALRRWYRDGGLTGTPCDRVIVCAHPVADLTKRQAAMAKGIWKIWGEVEPQLAGAVIVEYR
jgi:hypothetical protein